MESDGRDYSRGPRPVIPPPPWPLLVALAVLTGGFAWAYILEKTKILSWLAP
jgi:hypothetical protein